MLHLYTYGITKVHTSQNCTLNFLYLNSGICAFTTHGVGLSPERCYTVPIGSFRRAVCMSTVALSASKAYITVIIM